MRQQVYLVSDKNSILFFFLLYPERQFYFSHPLV